MLEKVKALANQFSQETINNRRYLHTNPELSFQEYNSQKYIKAKLEEIGLKPIQIAVFLSVIRNVGYMVQICTNGQ